MTNTRKIITSRHFPQFDRESFFIKKLIESGITQGIGDDCCILDSSPLSLKMRHKGHIKAPFRNFVLGMDSFCEGVHFLSSWFAPQDLAYKAFLVNYSDLIAMNATPKYAMLSVCLPKKWSQSDVSDFVKGIKKFAIKHSIRIIGGDTISSDRLQIHITMLGIASRKILYRDRIQKGSVLYYTQDRYPSQTIIQTAKTLRGLLLNHLRDSQKSPHMMKTSPKGRFLLPIIREGFIKDCSRFIRAGMDISDGIYSELSCLSQLNFLKFTPQDRISTSSYYRLMYNSGEVYEMLLAISPRDHLRLKRLSQKHRISVVRLGALMRGKMRLKARRWH
uniref:Thiamine-monophosphate kinase n=1 Tax=uncultured Helicobacter sp. TaxID=175537 RepID=A0A650EL12_9HELI|nr:thiamine-monophosphate kinase [uncultured Helicobacter sp.]